MPFGLIHNVVCFNTIQNNCYRCGAAYRMALYDICVGLI